ncbi:hypothetical protein M3196_15160 [Fictibacillus nanhaiensis]|jgi:hypothetical protein|uniref:hypothetical protein n=1 Tax=Fictibacillus nanhaiensis TaxID=742169 RepID=UPI00203C9257|nr:hypothetical protein [Fictibacillus nanhaiensis]MCM3732992.1 hypothetical protein [Fictibacillus nanhaiensis]
MKTKKAISSIFAMLGLLLLIPNAVLAAPELGPGEWDELYDNSFFHLYMYDSRCIDRSSGGGDFAVEVTGNVAYNSFMLTIYEEDGTGTTPKTVVNERMYDPNPFYQFSTAGLVDGTNNQAELRVCLGYSDENEEVRLRLLD